VIPEQALEWFCRLRMFCAPRRVARPATCARLLVQEQGADLDPFLVLAQELFGEEEATGHGEVAAAKFV
jgi:hypothetical protein